jgi:hypothetical protein
MLSIPTRDPDPLLPEEAKYSKRWKVTIKITIYGRTHILAI